MYTSFLARGDNFPDAMADGVLSAGIHDTTLAKAGVNEANLAALPLILTEPGALNDAAKAQIENFDVQHGLLVGGTAALSDGVKGSIEGLGLTTHRLAGPSAEADDRYWTATAVAEFAMRPSAPSATNEYPGLGFTDDVTTTHNEVEIAYLANGLKYPDALTIAPYAGRYGNFLNLTVGINDLGNANKDFLTKRASDVERAVAVGYGNAVSTAVLNEANKLASSK